MPLSEREQQILDEIERNLNREDARTSPRARSSRTASGTRVKQGVALFVAGLLLLVLGFFSTGFIPLGVIAFAAMVGGAALIATAAGSAIASSRDKLRDRAARAAADIGRRSRRR